MVKKAKISWWRDELYVHLSTPEPRDDLQKIFKGSWAECWLPSETFCSEFFLRPKHTRISSHELRTIKEKLKAMGYQISWAKG